MSRLDNQNQIFYPSSSLSSIRSLPSLSEEELLVALESLREIYGPFHLPATFNTCIHDDKGPSDDGAALDDRLRSNHDLITMGDSGYASRDERADTHTFIDQTTTSNSGNEHDQWEDKRQILRADEFEKDFARRWLTALLSRIETFDIIEDDSRERIADDAAAILAVMSVVDVVPDHQIDEDSTLVREFTFQIAHTHETHAIRHDSPGFQDEVRNGTLDLEDGSLSRPSDQIQYSVSIQLRDAPLSETDHTDVGLQSWGASIILSEMLCAHPYKFGLAEDFSTKQIVELGAGTGLVSLCLAKLIPQIHPVNRHKRTRRVTIIATDYHAAVLGNLQSNITRNLQHSSAPNPSTLRCSNPTLPREEVQVLTAPLDWSSPVLDAPLDVPADMIFAADVVYAPEHARWLRDCAAKILSPIGIFWLIVTVRTEGKFAGICDTVEAVFDGGQSRTSMKRGQGDGRSGLVILERERLERKKGIGRGDESGYLLFKIGWTTPEE